MSQNKLTLVQCQFFLVASFQKKEMEPIFRIANGPDDLNSFHKSFLLNQRKAHLSGTWKLSAGATSKSHNVPCTAGMLCVHLFASILHEIHFFVLIQGISWKIITAGNCKFFASKKIILLCIQRARHACSFFTKQPDTEMHF